MNAIRNNTDVLDPHSPIPLYYQLKELLESLIDAKEFKPGERIPSENELCGIYNISRTTVRQAINELVNSGKLMRTQGRGTFVSNNRIEKPTYRLSGFNQDMKDLGLKPKSKVLQFAPVMPPQHVRESLHLEENEAAIYLERLRFANNEVVGLDGSYFPFKRFIKLLDEDLENRSLYDLLKSKFNTTPARSTYYVEAHRCPRDLATHFQISPADPVLFLREIVYDQDDIPFEYGDEYYRADRYTFRVEIRKSERESFKGVGPKK